MKLGELFFALTVKGTGDQAIAKFDDAVVSAHEASLKFEVLLTKINDILEKMAVKIGAVTAEELEQQKIKEALLKAQDEELVLIEDTNKKVEKKITLLDKLKNLYARTAEKNAGFYEKLQSARFALQASTTALIAFTKAASDMAVGVDKISSLTGMSAENIQRLKGMAEQAGGSVDDIAGAVRHFQEEAVNISLGRGGNIGAWQFMGIDPKEDPMVILSKLQHKLKTMPTALGTTMGKDLGLSDDLMYFLKNADALQPTSKELILSESEMTRLKTFNFEFNKVWSNSKFIMSKLGAFVTPLANELIMAVDRMNRAIGNIMNKLNPYMESLQKIAPVLAAVFGIIAAKFYPIQLGLALMALIFDDLFTYLNGGKSVIGDWVNHFKDAASWVTAIKVAILAIADTLTLGAFTNFFGKIAEMDFGKAFSKMIDKMTGDEQGVFLNGSPISSMGSGSSATTNNVNIKVDGSKDPKATGAEVVKQFKKAVGDSYFQQPQGGH